ncbi:MAG: hypothetical protein CMO55_25970 [Verrucomicrobiales bacterium]|nr:hypothetical protein [Verrucomicrobiales bacterium]
MRSKWIIRKIRRRNSKYLPAREQAASDALLLPGQEGYEWRGMLQLCDLFSQIFDLQKGPIVFRGKEQERNLLLSTQSREFQLLKVPTSSPGPGYGK